MPIETLRKTYHQAICQQLLTVDSKGVPNNADRHSDLSVKLAQGIVRTIGIEVGSLRSPGQTAGKMFEKLTAEFLETAFQYLHHLHPGKWQFQIGGGIEEFEQYEHLPLLAEILTTHRELRATLGDYLISPDIVIGRLPVEDEEINRHLLLVDQASMPNYSPLRARNSAKAILHASISCKWTIRSDRSQNARTEGLNLIRNRKGHTPHIAIVTGEPYPQRIASLAIGTGDIDCVYHFALPELRHAALEIKNDAVIDMLDILVSGKRLRDISDLPFDLAT